ncbi:transporter associated domain-containing protein [Cucumibacter marinus]|uniref:transporter associated domain-containing protein n=1 Tax=Cucumibacter marinus TaxID=1121252 RepID=UPI00040B94B5|nr:transporter associated domain-containing protein [Cucumibacter marinus]
MKALFTRRSASLRDDLHEALRDESVNGDDMFSAGERSLIQNVLKLSQVRVDDVMVPRADIEAVDIADSVAHLVDEFRRAEHSRLPVFEDNLDRIVGMVHIKDLVAKLSEPAPQNSASGLPVRLRSSVLKSRIGRADLIRKVLYVPPSMPVSDLLQSMQATRVHMAIVVDEYGGTDGLVTIEDLLETVVGDIEDEHDEDDADLVRQIADGVYMADARVELDALAEMIGPPFDPGRHGDEVDTLGGLLFNLLGRVPVRGEVISRLRGFEFEVVQADPRRIKKVKITRRRRSRAAPRGTEAPAAGEGPPPGPVSDRPVSERPVSDRPASQRTGTERPVQDRPASSEPNRESERSAAE